MVATAIENVALELSFATPPPDLNTGAGLQAFNCKVRRTDNSTRQVTFTMYLLESGTRLNGGASIGTHTTTTNAEENFDVTWDATLLGTSDGSLVEIEIVAPRTGGPGAQRNAGEFQYIEWEADYTAPAGEDVLLADDLESASEVGIPAVGQEHVLLADDLESASEVTSPPIGQEHVLLAEDLESAGEVSVPVFVGISVLLADDLESASEVSVPVFVGISALLADDLESSSEVSQPVVGQEHVLLADDLETTSEVSQPIAGHVHTLLADDLESASEVTVPTATEVLGVHDLFADDLESASEVGIPVLAENVVYMRPDADDSVGSWTTDTGASTNLYQSIDEDPFNDSDFVRSEIDPTTSVYKARLSNPIEAPDSGGNHYVRYRYQKDDVNGQQINLTVRLIQGASTEIASWTHNNIGATISQVSQQLSSPEISSISDYDDLFLEFEADAA